MAAMQQTTSQKDLSSENCCRLIQIQFDVCGFNLQEVVISSSNGLAPYMRQAISRFDVDPVHTCKNVSLSLNESMS